MSDNVEQWKIDGVDHNVGIRNVYVNANGNLCIETTAQLGNTSKGNINIESMKNIQIKPGGKGDIRLYTDHCDDLEQAVIHAFDGTKSVTGTDDDIPVRLKINCTEVEINSKDAKDRNSGASIAKDGMDLKCKTGSSWNKLRVKGNAVDIRTYADKPGSGGGVALQIASCDSDLHENKLKIETDRIVDVDGGLPSSAAEWSSFYSGEGGKGIEIGTINSQMTSIYTKTYRFKADAPIYAVTRSSVSAQGDKMDYTTQADDSKDILPATSCTWAEIIAAVNYLKSQGHIS